jgi:hypothetical protein
MSDNLHGSDSRADTSVQTAAACRAKSSILVMDSNLKETGR